MTANEPEFVCEVRYEGGEWSAWEEPVWPDDSLVAYLREYPHVVVTLQGVGDMEERWSVARPDKDSSEGTQAQP